MKPIVLWITILLVVIVISLGLVLKSLGDVRPAVLPPIPPPSLPTSSPPEKTETYTNDLSLTLPAGYELTVYARDLPGARDLEFSPQGTLFVSLTSEGKVLAIEMNGETLTVLSHLNKPHGLAFHRGRLFVAEETKVSRYLWDENNLTAKLDRKILDLPKGGNHFTRSLVFDQKGNLYISLGSTCNVCVEQHPWLAAVVVSNADGNNPRVFSTGLRNAVFLTTHPKTDEVWVTEMGRDLLGDDIPPDEVNILETWRDNYPRSFGWPVCYGNKIHDYNFDKDIYYRGDHCLETVAPIYEIPAHSAPLGLVFIDSPLFPADWQGDLLVAYHGSWNRSVPTGYKVVRLKVRDNSKIAASEDFITGFLPAGSSQAIGRPVDLIMNHESLFISDDKAGVVYKLAKQP